MSYTLEQLYEIAGRDDRVTLVYFYENTEPFNLYGDFITIVIEYNQFERDNLEINYMNDVHNSTFGKVKMRYLTGGDLNDTDVQKLKMSGVDSEHIKSIIPSKENDNVYYKKETRAIKQITIPMSKAPKGGDYNWIYGFMKKKVEDGAGLSPDEREDFLAMKMFFEFEELTEDEIKEIYVDNVIKESIEQKYLDLKFEREVATKEEEERWGVLTLATITSNVDVLKKELVKSGENFKKLIDKDVRLYNGLIDIAGRFSERRLNVIGKRAIYLDLEGFLHVFLRHVEEFKVTEQFNAKTKFLWSPDDVIMVIKNVIESVDDEIQAYWEIKPNAKFSKYGKQTLYFQGDYYEFHVEGNGRLSTFYRVDVKSTTESV